MTVQLSTLRVAPEMDASKYTAGAQEKIAADKAMAASSAAAGQAVAATDTKISQAGDVLARLSRQYEQGYAAQQKFNQGLGQLNRGLEAGKISVEGAERILVGMNAKLGLMGDASDLAAKGQIQLAAAVRAANAQIAGQAIAAENASAAAKRMVAANVNAPMGRQNNFAALNATNQFQDIAITAATGQSLTTIALQQGTQLGMAMQMSAGAEGATGAVKMLGSAITGLFTPVNLAAIGITAAAAATIQWFMKGKDGAKTLDEALKAHSDTLRLLKDQYGALGEAAKNVGNVGGLAFTEASARNAQTLLQAQLRQKTGPFLDEMGGVGWVSGLLGNGGGIDRLRNLSGEQQKFAAPLTALIESAKNGKADLASFNQEVERLFAQFVGSSDNPAALRATADAIEMLGDNAFAVSGKFAPFADAINRLKVEAADGKPNLAAFNTEIERIGQADGLQKLADEAIIAGKEIVDLAQKASDLEKIIRRLEAGKRGPLIGSSAEDDRFRYLDDQRLAMRSAQRGFDADMLGIDARSPQQRAAAARAREAARDVNGESLEVRNQRIELAGKRALIEAEHSLSEAQKDRARSLDQALAGQKFELDLIGKTTGEQAKLRFEFERMQELREQAARTGTPIDEKEVAGIKAAAEAMGQYADALARAKLNNDLQFERSQLFLSPQEQQIASRLRGTGLGMNSPEAQMMRQNQQFADAKDAAKGFLTDFKSELIKNGDDVGAALGDSILTALMNSMSKQWEAIFDQLATAFASAITGQRAGGRTSAFGTATGFADMLFGGANDNYSPGAVTRAPLGAVGDILARSRGAIKSIESAGSGGYSALGPVLDNGNQALGAYQVMSNNLPSWSKEALGKTLSPSQFLGNPTAQDKIFDHFFGKSLAKYGNAQDAASVWFTGRPMSKGAGAQDILGTTGSAYVDKFNAALGDASKGLNSFGGGLGKMGEALGKFPSAPGLGAGGGGGLFSGFGNLFKATSSFIPDILSGARVGLFADGTEGAPPGWAWVGERGPELMNMRGGEIVRNNQRSAQMMAQHANQNRQDRPAKVDLHVNVYGGSGDDHIRALAEQGARKVVGEYNSGQGRGGFGKTQRTYNSMKA